MTVTSIALLQLNPGVTPSDLKDPLLDALKVMEAASNELAADVLANFPSHNSTHIPSGSLPAVPTPPKHLFHIYQQHEDPSLLYILGSWPSRSLHLNSFISTPLNTSIVTSLTPFVSFPQSTVHHIALNPALIPTSAPLLAIRHHAISPSNLASFSEAFANAQHHLAHFSNRPIASGWQLEKAGSGGAQGSQPEELGDGSEVFVIISGWDHLEHSVEGFMAGERGREYAKVREWIDEGGEEVRHAKRVLFD